MLATLQTHASVEAGAAGTATGPPNLRPGTPSEVRLRGRRRRDRHPAVTRTGLSTGDMDPVGPRRNRGGGSGHIPSIPQGAHHSPPKPGGRLHGNPHNDLTPDQGSNGQGVKSVQPLQSPGWERITTRLALHVRTPSEATEGSRNDPQLAPGSGGAQADATQWQAARARIHPAWPSLV